MKREKNLGNSIPYFRPVDLIIHDLEKSEIQRDDCFTLWLIALQPHGGAAIRTSCTKSRCLACLIRKHDPVCSFETHARHV